VHSLKELIYDKCEFEIKNLLFGKESQEYEACTFEVDSRKVVYRKAKITPTKTGQFVTLWKRNKAGVTQPHDYNDSIDIVVINTCSDIQLGQFVFPKSVLLQKGIFSTETKDGKRGFRVYPPWDNPTSNQAIKTQTWQLQYFLNYGDNLDISRAKKLYLQV